MNTEAGQTQSLLGIERGRGGELRREQSGAIDGDRSGAGESVPGYDAQLEGY
jgi:hypothetical protein